MEDKVLLCGATGKVKEELETAELYILPSNTEGMPNSLMEAMSLGIAVISTDCPCGGPAELITTGEDGILVPVKEAEMMAKAMEEVLDNREFREQLGKNALKIRERLHPDKVNAAWEEYLSSFIR